MLKQILGWFIPSKIILVWAGVLLVTHGSVYLIAQANQRAADKSAAIEGVKTHARIEREVIRLDDTDLDSRLAKWLRD